MLPDEIAGAVADPTRHDALARNPALSGQVLDCIAKHRHADWETLCGVARHPNTEPNTLRWLLTGATDDAAGDQIAQSVASNTSLPRGIAISMASWGMFDAAKRDLAQNPSISPVVLTLLADARIDPDVTRAATASLVEANLADIGTNLLEQLAVSGDSHFRHFAARSPNTPPRTLDHLAGDQRDHIRAAVAANANTEPGTLQNLSRDVEYAVRAAVGANPSNELSVLTRLGDDLDANVRAAVAANPTTHREDVARLLHTDTNSGVAKAALRWPGWPSTDLDRLAHSPIPAHVVAVCAHPNVGIGTLRACANSDFDNVQVAVASAPKTPLDVLDRLCSTKSPNVVNAVLSNPAIAAHITTRSVTPEPATAGLIP